VLVDPEGLIDAFCCSLADFTKVLSLDLVLDFDAGDISLDYYKILFLQKIKTISYF
jgi:hypothetical protein